MRKGRDPAPPPPRARKWWTMLDLNQRPPACEAGALPTELIVRARKSTGLWEGRQPRAVVESSRVPRRSSASLDVRQRGGDRTLEGLLGEGLLHERPARLLDACHLVARHQHDLDPRPEPLYAAGELSAIHERHDEIDQEQVE